MNRLEETLDHDIPQDVLDLQRFKREVSDDFEEFIRIASQQYTRLISMEDHAAAREVGIARRKLSRSTRMVMDEINQALAAANVENISEHSFRCLLYTSDAADE